MSVPLLLAKSFTFCYQEQTYDISMLRDNRCTVSRLNQSGNYPEFLLESIAVPDVIAFFSEPIPHGCQRKYFLSLQEATDFIVKSNLQENNAQLVALAISILRANGKGRMIELFKQENREFQNYLKHLLRLKLMPGDKNRIEHLASVIIDGINAFLIKSSDTSIQPVNRPQLQEIHDTLGFYGFPQV